MTKRQRRSDETTAKAVARGVNILGVRDPLQAQRYMEHKLVPPSVIARVLASPLARRRISAEQSVSEAITPTPSENPQE